MEASTSGIGGRFISAFALLAPKTFLFHPVSSITLNSLLAAKHLVANTEQSLRFLRELRAAISSPAKSITSNHI